MMKKIQLILAASAALLIGTTACKTSQKVQSSDAQQSTKTETTHTVNRNYKALSTDLLNGEWIIVSALEKPVVGNEIVNIFFDIDTQRVYGNNGCNTFSGTLSLGKHCSIAFTDCITTLMACHPEITERNVMQALGATTHYNTIKNDNTEISINLLDEQGNVVATLTRQMSQQLNGYWNIIEVSGKKVKLDEKPTMVLDLEAGKLTGNSGCNIMNGTINYNATANDNKISFNDVASTRRMCAPDAMEVEDKVLDTLNKIDAFRIINNNKVELYSTTDEKTIIVLQRK